MFIFDLNHMIVGYQSDPAYLVLSYLKKTQCYEV